MTPRQIAALRAALDWRDRIAQRRDRAPFRVVGDSVLAAVALERPGSVAELASLKGMSSKLVRSEGERLLEELSRVDALPEEDLRPFPRGNRNGPGRPSPEEESWADAIRALRARMAQERGLDRGVLLSNAQIGEVVRSRPRTQKELARIPEIRRWQAELLSDGILGILKG